jgi:pectate lyase
VPTALPDTNILGWAAYAVVTGGAGGTETTVSDYASLRAACRSAGPVIIHVNGILVPNEPYCYIEGYDKTIIGVGTNSGLAGYGFRVAGTNIIIANLSLNSTNSNSDGVTLDTSSHGTGRNVWVDHCEFYACTDGSVDVTKGAESVTVSWCKFHYQPVPKGTVIHEFVDLIGSSDSDSGTSFHVTFHHNWYSSYCRERMPSVRFGHVHVFNNYYDCFDNNYCVRTRINAEVLVENNYFLGVQNPWERFVTTGSPGLLKAAGNITNNCTFVNGWVTGAVVIPGTDTLGPDLNPPPYSYTLTPATDVPYYVQTYSGNGKYPYAP